MVRIIHQGLIEPSGIRNFDKIFWRITEGESEREGLKVEARRGYFELRNSGTDGTFPFFLGFLMATQSHFARSAPSPKISDGAGSGRGERI